MAALVAPGGVVDDLPHERRPAAGRRVELSPPAVAEILRSEVAAVVDEHDRRAGAAVGPAHDATAMAGIVSAVTAASTSSPIEASSAHASHAGYPSTSWTAGASVTDALQ